MIKDKPQAVRFPRLGKIKVGMKNDRGLPVSVDYFIPSGKYADEVKKLYGDKPKKIKVLFPFDDIEKNLNEFYREYKSSGLYRICDGFRCNKVGDDGNFSEIDCEKEIGCKCNASMSLQFIISGVPVAGIWAFDSGGYYSRMNVRSAMAMAMALGGKLQGIPFWMSVSKEQSNTAGNSNVFSVVNLAPAMSSEDLMKFNTSALPALPESDVDSEIDFDEDQKSEADIRNEEEADRVLGPGDPGDENDNVPTVSHHKQYKPVKEDDGDELFPEDKKEKFEALKEEFDETTPKKEKEKSKPVLTKKAKSQKAKKKLSDMTEAELIKMIEEQMAPVIGDAYRHFKQKKIGFRELFELDRNDLQQFAQELYDDLYSGLNKK